MMQRSFMFTSESVSEGHPDKVCDRISDAVVDAFLEADPESRVACETLVTTGRVVLAGEVRVGLGAKSHLMGADGVVNKESIKDLVRATIRQIGYEQDGFHWQHADVQVHLHGQSADIARGVDATESKDEGAGDQGIMFGYACNETPQLMPAPIQYAHTILRALSDARHAGKEPLLGPDAKSQITLRYENSRPVCATAVVISTQHVATNSQGREITSADIRDVVRPYVVDTLPTGWMCEEDRFYVNPTGRFVIGGPDGDAGLTGRKIIVDTYGGAAPHGGGAFSGKDPTKVDRSAAYAARYLAKNVVAARLAERCTIQLSYAIGVSRPLSVYVDTQGTGHVDEGRLGNVLQQLVDLSPRGIRTHLGLNRPIYGRTSAYGHFGRMPDSDGGFSWERTDLVDELRRAF